MSHEVDAREDWERRIYRRLDGGSGEIQLPDLPAPAGLIAQPAIGHVRLGWEPVDGAVGYLVERTDPGGQTLILEHGGSDVAAVPGPEFADTDVADGATYRYRIGAVARTERPEPVWSEPVTAGTAGEAAATVTVTVDAAEVAGQLERVWQMVGSERLSQFDLHDDGQGHDVGAEFLEALRMAHDDLGVTRVRAHAILHDDVGVVRRDAEGRVRYDFGTVDPIYDRLLDTGIRPIVELSFMPAALARHPEQTVFTYRGIISPPSDWSEWHDLVEALTAHLVERYGTDEVLTWAFEVWNEPNLEVFWAGTKDEYFRLYDEAARAVKGVDPRLRIGGPSSSAGEWVEELAAHCAETGAPLDFASTHTYGNVPVDVRPALERHGFEGVPLWWTEWGVGHSHFGPVHDAVIGAPFVLSGFASAQGRLEALAYWVISDHFEELGRPPRLFHDGFGLLTVGNLRKPRYWAAHLAAHQGDEVLASTVRGDGADVLVQAWATRHQDGTLDVLVWNGTVNAALLNGSARLGRSIDLTIDDLAPGGYQAHLARIDETHSNIQAHCPDDVDWPDAALGERLRAQDHLDEQALPDVPATGGSERFQFDLPMPGVVRLRLIPIGSPSHDPGSTSK